MKWASQDYSGRLAAIDQLRALAIASMMIAHFGPGALARLPGMDTFANPILFWGRLATVAFVFVFGVTVGFVFYERFRSDRALEIARRLWARAILIAICAIIICVPEYAQIWHHTPTSFTVWLFATYSVLNFYALAFASVPVWLFILGSRPLRNGLLSGLCYWGVAEALLATWSEDPNQGVGEYVRINLVAGPYAYLQLGGVALVAIPIGIYLRRSFEQRTHTRYLQVLAPIGLMLTLCGWSLGQWTGEFAIGDIIAGTVKSPPRLWYWMFFSGPALLLLFIFATLELGLPRAKQLLYPLALFGQAALPIYTAHSFVLPGIGALDKLVVIEGVGRIVVPLAAFGAFCLIVMYHRHCSQRRQLPTVTSHVPA